MTRESTVARATPRMPMGGMPGIQPKRNTALSRMFSSNAEELIKVLALTRSMLFITLRYGWESPMNR